MVARFSAVCIAAGLLLAPSAHGQQVKDPRETQAQKDCLTGKVESGVTLLAELYAETGNANFIYNQARCYEQNARATDAINHFHEYLRVAKDITPEDKAAVDKHIEECHAMQAEQAQRAPITAAPVAQPSFPATPALDISRQPASESKRKESRPMYKTWWFWTGAGAITAGIVTAIILASGRSGSNVPTTPLGNQEAF